MDSVYANPVGIIKKDIYIITNKINGKVYVGQSQNSAIRFKQHCKLSNMSNSIIGRAIQKYGKENFAFHVIEKQITNYNDREKFWISYYNSVIPFGYNILDGGENPPTLYGDDSPHCILPDYDLKELINELRNTKTPYAKLALKYGISKRQVMRINNGVSRKMCDCVYPIRHIKNINGKLTNDDVDCIIDMLKHTYLFNGEIAKMFNVEVHAISDINNGITHKHQNEIYPIREWKSSGKILFTYEQVTEIINLLQNTSLSLNKIAKQYNVNVQPIQEINNGSSKKYRRREIVYPIRNY